MRVVALVKGIDHVCTRYRVEAFRPYLEKDGYRLDLLSWPKSIFSKMVFPTQIGRVDVLILQRKLASPWQMAWFRRLSKALVFDFDDAVFYRNSYAKEGFHSPKRAKRFHHTVTKADYVVAGNDFLKAKALENDPNTNVLTIPTCVDTSRYPVAQHTERPFVDLVWVGSASTLQGLLPLTSMFNETGEAIRRLRFKIICNHFLRLESLPVVECIWSEATEVKDIVTADIGVSWVPPDPWSEGKCGLKVLQFMAAGLPVVANPVGVQKQMVEHGKTGFLVETPEDFQRVVARLVADPSLRRSMGLRARQRVENEYDVAVGARKWLQILGQFRDQQNPTNTKTLRNAA
ncbi:MAG: glycosyltransferase family 4 protein [Gemmataceae bacterium]